MTRPSSNGFGEVYRGKRVLVTGHTGFKGAWLSEWLLELGADVFGLALAPNTQPALFEQLGLAPRLKHRLGDIRDLPTVEKALAEAAPDFVFHLAAQPLVRLSYEQPVETFASNVMGTIHVLEAVKRRARPCVVIAVTTDKCYENREDGSAYREDEPLGGHDPYSASKAATEVAIAAYRRSFFGIRSEIRMASARAGNVIGGGDWALDRIVPDCIRALQRGQAIPVRNPAAVRPWQHVLEPLGGYLLLAARLAASPLDPQLVSAFNFGPAKASNRMVRDLVESILLEWPGTWTDGSDPGAVHEAKLLNLDIAKADRVLGWRPAWDFARTVTETVRWYRDVSAAPARARDLTVAQIRQYVSDGMACGTRSYER